MLTWMFAAVLVLPPTTGSLQTTDATARFVASLTGHWRGTGTVTGRASDMTMQWSREVGDAFVHLRFRNQMAAGVGRPAEVFEGRGYYRITSSRTGSGVWIDSRGVIFPVAFSLTADTITSDWGTEATERGRTVYRLETSPTGQALIVTDFVRAPDGQYREFGRTRLERVK